MDLILIVVLTVIFAWNILLTIWVQLIDTTQNHLMFDILSVLHTISDGLDDKKE